MGFIFTTMCLESFALILWTFVRQYFTDLNQRFKWKLIRNVMQNEQLNRFLEAQEGDYENALKEIKSGRKRSHWMWYIFPQIAGLGYSAMSKKYAIENLNEAEAYLKHPILGARLVTISKELLRHSGKSAYEIFGSPDDMKLHSCMTLFSSVPAADSVFSSVLSLFFNGNKDPETLRLLIGAR